MWKMSRHRNHKHKRTKSTRIEMAHRYTPLRFTDDSSTSSRKCIVWWKYVGERHIYIYRYIYVSPIYVWMHKWCQCACMCVCAHVGVLYVNIVNDHYRMNSYRPVSIFIIFHLLFIIVIIMYYFIVQSTVFQMGDRSTMTRTMDDTTNDNNLS